MFVARHWLAAVLGLACFVCSSLVLAQSPPDWIAMEANISYGDHEAQRLDIMQPKAETTGKRPGVVVFHGGGWIRSTKETTWNALCFPYLEKGFVVCNVEYRVAPQAEAPAAVIDALTATRWFFEHADKYNVDPTRIVITGASAGGHLALMAGMATADAGLGEPIKAAAIINGYGITDVADLLDGPHRQSWAAQWLPEQESRNELAVRVSPMTYVRKDLPPVFTVQGQNDRTVPLKHGQRITEALKAAGAEADIMVVGNAAHGFSGEQWPKVNERIFEFLAAHDIVQQEAAPTPQPPTKPTLYVVGDSTASNSRDLGWGSHLGKYFNDERVNVVNRARGGRSSRTFQNEGLWDQVLEQLKPGDFVLIQFGHNDGGPVNSPPARGSLRGLGEETQEITKRNGETEVVHTFGWYMRKYIADTREKGATPIVLSLTVRNEWRDGKVERGSGNYSRWAAEVAKATDCWFVDATNIIADHYEMLGEETVKPFFPIDHTHTSAEGANLNAQLIVAGLKTLPEPPPEDFLSEAGRAIEPLRPRSAEAQ